MLPQYEHLKYEPDPVTGKRACTVQYSPIKNNSRSDEFIMNTMENSFKSNHRLAPFTSKLQFYYTDNPEGKPIREV